ncbi:MAG: 4-vinyl reductase [Aquificaceae bacterium]|nr:4-vinyl reductase [Aquificaceae bacterium]MCS7195906.1 4-vinyl reductase [Aquificaceae bacterium]MCX7989249.1 4-vinyl reductase [Aquificaceae bacterium]MDW8032894.1 V4R domain-containing protein [Aquificaceae bacterium]MDW8294942.1 V4R domain-containing protein [Aquificaceae bacterium]
MEYLKDKFRALAEAIERESVLVHRAALVDGYRDIYKLSRLGIDKVIKKATEYGGRKGAKILKERYGIFTDRLDEALDVLTVIAESSRLLDVFEYDLDRMEIRVDGSILVEAVGDSKKPVCEPMAGFFEGFLSELLEKRLSVKEVACKAQGHERCVFKISLK